MGIPRNAWMVFKFISKENKISAIATRKDLKVEIISASRLQVVVLVVVIVCGLVVVVVVVGVYRQMGQGARFVATFSTVKYR